MNVFRRLAATLALAAAATFAMAQPLAAAAPQGGATMTSTKPNLVDINSATAPQLSALPGIGDVYSKKIIAGRPYKMKNQLVSKGVLPQGVYNKIAGMIIAKQSK